MPNREITRFAGLAGLTVLYVLLYRLSGYVSSNEALASAASIFFLPAFVRLLGYLIAGLWAVPALFVAALFCVDLGLGLEERILVSAFLAVGGPLGAHFTSRLIHLDRSLSNLSPLRLLAVSLGCAAGNALFYETALALVGMPGGGPARLAAILLGDTLGTWAIIYVLKLSLTIWGRTLRR